LGNGIFEAYSGRVFKNLIEVFFGLFQNMLLIKFVTGSTTLSCSVGQDVVQRESSA